MLTTRARAQLVALVATCSSLSAAEAAAPLGALQQAVVYGSDDRVEAYEAESALLQSRAKRSVAALVPPESLSCDPEGVAVLSGETFGGWASLCPGERFAEQLSLAECSAVLIEDDLLLTAAHCLGRTRATAEADCERALVVFGLVLDGPERMAEITAQEVFGCRRLVAFAYSPEGPGEADYAVFQLDRPTGNRQLPVPVAAAPPREGQRVHSIGFGGGLPAKVDSGGQILHVDAKRRLFGADIDHFGGGSGGAVLNEEGELLGLSIRGARDFEFDSEEPCRRVAVATGGFEEIGWAKRAVEAVCATGWPSERLCPGAPACGDACAVDAATRSAPLLPVLCEVGGEAPGSRGVVELRIVEEEPSSPAEEGRGSYSGGGGLQCSAAPLAGPPGGPSLSAAAAALALLALDLRRRGAKPPLRRRSAR